MTWWMWVTLVAALIVLALGIFWWLTEGRDRRRWNKAMNQPAFRAAFERTYGVSLSPAPRSIGTFASRPEPKTVLRNWRDRADVKSIESAVIVLSGSPGTAWQDAVNQLGTDRLVQLLSDRDFTLACRAAAGLGHLRAKQAVPDLIRTLTHEDWGVRNNAAMALGEIGDPSAIDALNKATIDRDGTVARNAEKALAKIAGNPGSAMVRSPD